MNNYLVKIGNGWFPTIGNIKQNKLFWKDPTDGTRGVSEEFIKYFPREYSVKERTTLWRK